MGLQMYTNHRRLLGHGNGHLYDTGGQILQPRPGVINSPPPPSYTATLSGVARSIERPSYIKPRQLEFSFRYLAD